MVVLVLALVASFAAGEINEGDVYVGSGQTASKTQAKMWFNDGAWWCVLLDGSDHYVYRFQGTTAVKLEDAFVDSRNSAQADVLWTGEYLFALMGHRSAPRLYKFLYDPLLQTYVPAPGFPVELSMGSSSLDATIAVDSTGKAWIAYNDGGDIRVIWSTSSNHDSWNQSGTTIATGAESFDVAAIAAFDNRVGVMWSNQNDSAYGFREHRDGQAEGQWDNTVIVSDISGIAEDHINLSVTPDQELLAATKNKSDVIHLWRRSTSGAWSGYEVAQDGTRPNVVYDAANDDVYVLYTGLDNSRPIMFKRAPLSDLSRFASTSAEVFLGSDRFNDVTTTKQPLTEETGLLAGAKGGNQVSFRRIAFGTPLADASASTYEGHAPLAIDFFGDGLADDDDSIASYAWTLGDGTTSNKANPSHTYDEQGLYEATLTVTDRSGRTATASIHVNVLEPVAPAPDTGGGDDTTPPPPLGELVAAINFQPPEVTPPPDYLADTGVPFDATRGYGWDDYVSTKSRGADEDVRLDTYVYVSNPASATWEYVLPQGDYMVTVVAGSPQWTGVHYISVEGTTIMDGVFTDRGEYTTVDHPTTVSDGRLTVRIGGGDSKKTKICYLVIRTDGDTQVPTTPPAPTASIGTDTTSGDAPLTVSFTGTGTSDGGSITGYAWDFGDGTSSTAQNPAHTFAQGTYTVELTVTDNYGQTGTATTQITANEPAGGTQPSPPTASIGTDITSGDAPLTVSFTGTGTSDSSIVGYAWSFGDGGTSASQNPTHTFDEGTYTVTLTVTDDYGQTGTASTTITVDPAPTSGGEVIAQVNFQPDGTTPPAGYIADTGGKYSSAAGFGWSDWVGRKQRNELSDVRLDTYVYVSNPDSSTWEYDLPNGDYAVELVMGSPQWSGIHYLTVEGVRVIDGVETGGGEFVEVNRTFTVSDGRLSVMIGGDGTDRKSKICYLIIRRAG